MFVVNHFAHTLPFPEKHSGALVFEAFAQGLKTTVEQTAAQFVPGFPTEALPLALRNRECHSIVNWSPRDDLVMDLRFKDFMRRGAVRLRGQSPKGKPPSHVRYRL